MKEAIVTLLTAVVFTAAAQQPEDREAWMSVYFNRDSSSIYVVRVDYIDGRIEKAEMRCDLSKAPYEESCKLYHNGEVVGVYPHDRYEIDLVRLLAVEEEGVSLPGSGEE